MSSSPAFPYSLVGYGCYPHPFFQQQQLSLLAPQNITGLGPTTPQNWATAAGSEGGAGGGQSAPDGADYAQQLNAAGGYGQPVSVPGGGYSQSLSTARGYGQALSAAGGLSQALSAAGGYSQALNAAGGYSQALSAAGGFSQALSAAGGYGQALSAARGYTLGAVPSLGKGYAGSTSATRPRTNHKADDRSPPEPAVPIGGGEGEEYLQELMKERDSIESSSSSSLSKTHILRLLNKGEYGCND